MLSFEISLLCNKPMSPFDYESVHKNKHTCFFMNNLHKTKSLNVCDEFPNGCNLHKDQVLNAFVILNQNYISLVFCILQVFYMVCQCCVGLYLCNLSMS